jgi:phosphohistidine phosphatase
VKSLLIIRHAKSSWDTASLSDFDRPLNERGKKDAVTMAQRLHKRKIRIDAFISSPARRAKKTAEVFAQELGMSNIIFEQGLYHAPASFLYGLLRDTDDKFNTVAIFSHNPGITEFVNTLTDTIRTDNVPTCGIFAVKTVVNSWKDFESAGKEYWFYDYPKLGN